MQLAAGNPGTVSLFGQSVSSWTLIVLLLGIVIGMYIRHKM
jgi:hypothetical protein